MNETENAGSHKTNATSILEVASAFAGRAVKGWEGLRAIILLLVPVIALGLALIFSGRTLSGIGTLGAVPLSLICITIAKPLEHMIRMFWPDRENREDH